MKISNESNGERKVFDVHASKRRSRFSERGHNVVNLRPRFMLRHPLISASILLALVVLIFFGVRQFSARSEVQDFFPTTCLGNWQNPANAEGSPETLGNVSTSYSEDNSAVYVSGAQIFCGGFLPQDFATSSGNITNVGLTLVWQIGDTSTGSAALSAPADETPTASDASSTIASSTDESSTIDTAVASSSVVSASSTTDMGTTNSTDDSNEDTSTDVSAPPPAPVPTPAPASTSPATDINPADDSAPSSTGVTSLLSKFIPIAFADEVDSTTITLGPPLVADLAPASSTPSSIASSSTISTNATGTASSTTLSMSTSASPDENFLEVSYSTDGQTWVSIGEVSVENWQQFTITLPISDWTNLANLQIRIEGIPTTQDPVPPVYLDGMFMEVHYDVTPFVSDSDTVQNAPPTVVVLPPEQQPTLLDSKTDFTADEAPSFDFDLGSLPSSTATSSTVASTTVDSTTIATTTTTTTTTTSSNTTSTPVVSSSTVTPSSTFVASGTMPQSLNIIGPIKAFFAALTSPFQIALRFVSRGWGQEAYAQADMMTMPTVSDPVVAQIYDPSGQLTDLQPVTAIVNDQLIVNLPQSPPSFYPGRYTLKLWILENNTIYATATSFTWGVLVVNFNKSIYTLNDIAHIGFGVLTDQGHTVCNASISATVTSPSGIVTNLDTADGSIQMSPTCGPQTVTNHPDYTAHMPAAEVGTYTVAVTAEIPAGTIRTINDSFEVQNLPLFDVSRSGPTRIFPPAEYQMAIKITANQAYAGPVTETLPSSFAAIPEDGGAVQMLGDTQTITWQVNLNKGDTETVGYLFYAPDVSPALYKLGPLQIGSWQEARQWQIAGDVATITFVQAQEVNPVTGNSSIVTIATTKGDLIVVVQGANTAGVTNTTSTDSAKNTYFLAATSTNGSGQVSMYYAPNAAAVATTTCNYSGTITTNGICIVYELSGVATSSPLDIAVGSTTASMVTNATSGIYTTHNPNDVLIFGVRVGANETTYTAGTGFTIPANATNTRGAVEYDIVTSTRSNTNAVMTYGITATNYMNVFGAFKAAGSPPNVSGVVLNGGSAITLVPNATTSISVVASTTPGVANILYATSTIYRSGVGATCTANNQNCYQIASSSCSFSGATSTVTCSAPIYYFAQATDASSSFSGQKWLAAITVTDAGGLTTTSSTVNGVTLNTLLAINVSPASINYGTLKPNANTGSTNQTVTVQNAGNSSTTLQISGTAFVSGSRNIATSSQHYATSTFTFGGSEQQLSGTLTTVSGFLLTSPTSTTNVQSNTFWGNSVPSQSPTGTYTSTLTFSATFSP